MKLDYQVNAIAKINKIVEEYNGVFISDVVGLGKTYIAAMFAKTVNSKILVIAPPPIVPNWVGAFKDFDISKLSLTIGAHTSLDYDGKPIDEVFGSNNKNLRN